MKISGVIDPDFEFSTLWTLPLAKSIPKFFLEVILPEDNLEQQKVLSGNNTQKQELTYRIGVVSCFTLFPLLLYPLKILADNDNPPVPLMVPVPMPMGYAHITTEIPWYPDVGVQKKVVCNIAFALFLLVFALTLLAAAILTLPAIVPIAMARGGHEFFRKGGVLDECKASIRSVFQPKSS